MLIEELTGDVRLEDSECEFKARLNRDDPQSWLKTIAGFANAEGGTFYIGVEDRSHKLIGFMRNEADAERNYFNNQLNEHVSPRPPYKVSFLRYEVRDKERFVLQIRVDKSSVRPVIVKYDGIPAIYMRREGFTNGATYEEIISMSVRSQSAAYDTLPSDEHYDRSSFSDLFAFCRQHAEGKELTDKALASLGFFNRQGVLANGAVLFRDGYDGRKTKMQCSVFSGFTKGSERIVTINHYDGNLTGSIDYAYSFVLQRMNHTIVKLDDSHRDIEAFPRRALFEGVVNAVAHRDYFLDGTQVQIDLFRDRLEITSPGNFFHGESLNKTYDLTGIISKRRNELVCGVLVACDVMEAAGTGFDKIAEEYAGADEAHRPYIHSSSDHFTLVLPDLTYGAGVEQSDLPALEFVPVPGGSAYDARVLSYCYRTAHTAAEIAVHLGISDSTHLRRGILGALVRGGYLSADKVGRATYYRTDPTTVRLA